MIFSYSAITLTTRDQQDDSASAPDIIPVSIAVVQHCSSQTIKLFLSSPSNVDQVRHYVKTEDGNRRVANDFKEGNRKQHSS